MKWLELPIAGNGGHMVTVNPGRILTVREDTAEPLSRCRVEMNIPDDNLVIALSRAEVHALLLAL